MTSAAENVSHRFKSDCSFRISFSGCRQTVSGHCIPVCGFLAVTPSEDNPACLPIILHSKKRLFLQLFIAENSHFMVRAWGFEPQRISAQEPKSCMSASSIMPAYSLFPFLQRRPFRMASSESSGASFGESVPERTRSVRCPHMHTPPLKSFYHGGNSLSTADAAGA